MNNFSCRNICQKFIVNFINYQLEIGLKSRELYVLESKGSIEFW